MVIGRLRTLVLLSAIFACNIVNAQLEGKNRVDSLLTCLPKQKEDSSKVELLNDLSHNYSFINPDTGIEYAKQALELANKLNWKRGVAGAMTQTGINYNYKGNYEKALEYYFKALKLYNQFGGKVPAANVNRYIGMVYMSQGKHPAALEYYFKALKMYEESGDKEMIANALGGIAAVYGTIEDLPKALDYFLKALKIHKEAGDKEGIASVTGNLGIVYESLGDYSKALAHYEDAVKIAEEIGDKRKVALFMLNMGVVYQIQDKYLRALACHHRSLTISREIGDVDGEAAALVYIGNDFVGLATSENSNADDLNVDIGANINTFPQVPDSLLPRGREAKLRKAVQYMSDAIAIQAKLGVLDQLKDSYRSLAVADSLLGDYKGAYLAQLQYVRYRDSVFSQENKIKIINLENAQKAEAEAREQEKKAATRRNYELVGGGLLLLAALVIILQRRNNSLLDKEKRQSDNLLRNILPAEVAEELKDKGATEARHFDNVSVLFTDFVNFTQAAEKMSPQGLIDELHSCFKAFDEITSKYGIEKIKTIGDAYLAACGLPLADPRHADNIVRAAIEINAFMQDRLSKLGSERTFSVRIGIHSGSVVAGIVGVKKFAYDIWGDTVNTAARMEQNSEAGKINISQTTYELVKDKFNCEYRGEVEAKGKGVMKMYFVS